MIELLMLIGIVYWLGTTFGDDVGTIAISVLIVGLLIGLCRAGRSVNKAYGNFIDYWAEGGPNKRK